MAKRRLKVRGGLEARGSEARTFLLRVIGRMASILVAMNRSASDIPVYWVYFLNRGRETVDLRTCGGGR